MPMPLTSLTIVKIFSNPLFLPARSLHAAPMQNRVEPLALALRAASSTGSMSTRRDAFVGVLYEEDWEQYLQFSLHPPATSQPSPSTAHPSWRDRLLIFIRVHSWIREGSWCMRCTEAWDEQSVKSGAAICERRPIRVPKEG